MGDTSTNSVTTRGLTKKFGDFIAVDHVDFAINRNETLAIIGPNGAGKTTFLNLVTGYYLPDNGTVLFEGRDITRLSPEKRVSLGITRTFQLVRVFDNLTVYENLGLAYYRKKKGSSFPFHMFFSFLDHADIEHKVDENLKMFDLGNLKDEKVGSLSIGSKRRLEIVTAFISDPKMLVLDEPFAGLSDREIDETLKVFKKYSGQKTLLIVEHKISKLVGLVDRLAVMHEGKIIASGLPEETLEDPKVRQVYWKLDVEELEHGWSA
jgi:ABC-type branched-subunit amino acid transport system ATPase component